jgi:hypothetical protein
MEDRVPMALALIAIMALGFGWLVIRYFAKRRAFKNRQAGRDKSMKTP